MMRELKIAPFAPDLGTEQDARALLLGEKGRVPVALEQRQVQLPLDADRARVLLSTCMDRESEPARPELTLRAAEGVILKLPDKERGTS
jgi:hypothetical protein